MCLTFVVRSFFRRNCNSVVRRNSVAARCCSMLLVVIRISHLSDVRLSDVRNSPRHNSDVVILMFVRNLIGFAKLVESDKITDVIR